MGNQRVFNFLVYNDLILIIIFFYASWDKRKFVSFFLHLLSQLLVTLSVSATFKSRLSIKEGEWRIKEEHKSSYLGNMDQSWL